MPIDQKWQEFEEDVVKASGAPAEIHELLRCSFYSGAAAFLSAMYQVEPDDISSFMASAEAELKQYMEE